MSYSKSELQTLHLRWKKTRHCAADDWPFRQPDRKAEIFYFKAFDAKFHDLQHSVFHAAANIFASTIALFYHGFTSKIWLFLQPKILIRLNDFVQTFRAGSVTPWSSSRMPRKKTDVSHVKSKQRQ